LYRGQLSSSSAASRRLRIDANVKVLLLDDAGLVRERLTAMVGALRGVEISAVGSGAPDAEERIRELRPDVVLVDVHSPRAMGLDLIRRIKSGGARPVVIALSSSPSFLYRVKCHEAGAAYYFDKVREQDRLVEAIVQLSRELA
jgi:DNA-binding NarL/FixJ family response regulator